MCKGHSEAVVGGEGISFECVCAVDLLWIAEILLSSIQSQWREEAGTCEFVSVKIKIITIAEGRTGT